MTIEAILIPVLSGLISSAATYIIGRRTNDSLAAKQYAEAAKIASETATREALDARAVAENLRKALTERDTQHDEERRCWADERGKFGDRIARLEQGIIEKDQRIQRVENALAEEKEKSEGFRVEAEQWRDRTEGLILQVGRLSITIEEDSKRIKNFISWHDKVIAVAIQNDWQLPPLMLDAKNETGEMVKKNNK